MKWFEYLKHIIYDIFTLLTDIIMDFSPYKKNRFNSLHSQPTNSRSKTVKYFYIALFIALGILVVWFLQSMFSEDKGTSVYATFEKNTSIAESQRENIGIWSAVLDNSPITEGDTVHIKSENDSKIILPDSSFFSLGEDSEITINQLRKTDENVLFGNIKVNKAPILFSGKSDFEKEKELKIFVANNIYVSGGKNTFYFNNNIVSFVDGEKVWVSRLEDNGKIGKNVAFGIGQSLDISTFSLIPTSDLLRSAELVAQYKGEKISEATAEDTLEETTDLSSPTLISPKFDGTAIVVKNGKQKIKGTASLDAKKVIIAFSNGTKTEELTLVPSLSDDKKTREWSYTASEQYKTLLNGLNSYKIYAVNADKKRSSATVLLLTYDKSDSENTDENTTDNNTDENTNDETSTETDTNFAIIAPNQGRDTEMEGDTVILNGTAGKDVAYITISNMTLDSSYTLQQYKKGQKTWKYWVDDLKPDTYKYVVYAKDENKKILSTQKISITLTQAETTQTPTPTAKPSTTQETTTPATATPKPVTTTGSNTTETATATPKPTPKPTITSSTSEASR